MKDWLCAGLGAVGGFISTMFGGWSMGIMFLIIFMAIDYISGLAVAGVFKNSKKTDSGALESRAGWKGLCRKGMTLAIIIVAQGIDVLLKTTYVRDAVVIGFCINEAISIVENAGLMGLPLPPVIMQAIDVLTKKSNNVRIPDEDGVDVDEDVDTEEEE